MQFSRSADAAAKEIRDWIDETIRLGRERDEQAPRRLQPPGIEFGQSASGGTQPT